MQDYYEETVINIPCSFLFFHASKKIKHVETQKKYFDIENIVFFYPYVKRIQKQVCLCGFVQRVASFVATLPSPLRIIYRLHLFTDKHSIYFKLYELNIFYFYLFFLKHQFCDDNLF